MYLSPPKAGKDTQKQTKSRRRIALAEAARNIKWDKKNSRGYQEKIMQGPMDLVFFSIVFILLVFGLIMMFSAGYAWAIKEEDGDGTAYISKQLIFSGLGLAGMYFLSYFDYHNFRKPIIAYGLYVFQLILLLMVKFSPLGREHNGARRWLGIPGTNFEFQPSEITKFAIIIIFAYLISMNYSKLEKFSYGVTPFLILLGIPAFLVLTQTHLSATIILLFIGAVLMFVGGSKFSHLMLVFAIAVGLGAIVIAYTINVKGIGYFTERINVWLDPFAGTSPKEWQTQNSLIAIGSGGLFGMGLGNSRQKFLYLPESKNDFVFAVVCEELGFCGAVLVILIFLMFVFRGFYIATKAPDKFGMIIVVGLTFQIGLQAMFNFAVVTNAIPNTGISLPFFSYGGTALCMQLAQMGVILNVSRQCIFSSPPKENNSQKSSEST